MAGEPSAACINATISAIRIVAGRKDSLAASVGIGVGEHTMNVSMVAASRGIHVVGYSLLAIKSID